jgi:xanthine dehydrogenase accessory factor
MSHIFKSINELLQKGQRSVLARIIRHTGSTPRNTGTRCLILEDGAIIGTIGGGLLEHQVRQKVKDVLDTGKSDLLYFRLTGKELEESEMLCGGTVDVYLEPLFPGCPHVEEIFHKADDMISRGVEGSLVTAVSAGIPYDDKDCRLLIGKDGERFGSISGYATKAASAPYEGLISSQPQLLSEQDEGLVFVEPLLPDNVLFLFGAGHISQVVASLAGLAGFKITVIDDRKEYANPERFPLAEEIRVSAFEDVFEQIYIDTSSYIAILTRGHVYDRDVLRQALETDAAYIGMIGSRRKIGIIFRSLKEEGVSEEKLKQVHSPIGLDIGAETPEEIAVSILAELIQIKAAHGKENRKIII